MSQVSTCEHCGKDFLVGNGSKARDFNGEIVESTDECSECFKMGVIDSFIDVDPAFEDYRFGSMRNNLYILLMQAQQTWDAPNNRVDKTLYDITLV
jgi:hypothetical protein